MTDTMTKDALIELLSLERRVDSDGAAHYYNAQGQLHRVYGPAIEHPDSCSWWQNGLRHRLDGPAVVQPDGFRAWWQNGKLHRIDGPAYARPDGYCAWVQNGLRHRIDGAAVEYSDGQRAWFIDGKELTEAEWQQAVASMATA